MALYFYNKKAPYKEHSIKINELKQITDMYNIQHLKFNINIFEFNICVGVDFIKELRL